MSIRNFQNKDLLTIGLYPSVKECEGPHISTERGLDKLCCAKCFALRTLSYKKIMNSYSGPLMSICDDIVEKYKFVKYTKSECGIPYFAYPNNILTAEITSIESCLKNFFKHRNTLFIADLEIKKSQILNTDYNPTIVFPSNMTKKYTEYGDDSGVLIEKSSPGKLKVISLDDAFKSGKYMYIINYYQTIAILTKNDTVVGKKLDIF